MARASLAFSPLRLAVALGYEALGVRLLAASLAGGVLAGLKGFTGEAFAVFASSYAAAAAAMAVAWLLARLGDGFRVYTVSGLGCAGAAAAYAAAGLLVSLPSYAAVAAGFYAARGGATRPPVDWMLAVYAPGYTLLAAAAAPQAAAAAMIASWLVGEPLAAPLMGFPVYAAVCAAASTRGRGWRLGGAG